MIVFLSTADTDLLAVQRAAAAQPALPSVEAANPTSAAALKAALESLRAATGHETAPDGAGAVVVLRLLGGRRATPEGVDRVVRACRVDNVPLIALSGDGRPDAELSALCTAPAEMVARVDAYLNFGGVTNAAALLRSLSDTYCGTSLGSAPPLPQPDDGIYHPDRRAGPVATVQEYEAWCGRRPDRPRVGVLFYRAHWLSGNLDFVDALVRALEAHGCDALPVFCLGLRTPDPSGGTISARGSRGRDERGSRSRAARGSRGCSAGACPPPDDSPSDAERPTSIFDRYFLDDHGHPIVDVLISTLSFAASQLSTPEANGLAGATEASGAAATWFEQLGVPVLQALVCTDSRATWVARSAGLSPLDVGMQVALPEFDGRIIAVPISFKEVLPLDKVQNAKCKVQSGGAGSAQSGFGSDAGTSAVAPRYVPDEERCVALAAQAAAWARLRRTPNRDKRIAIVLGSYPARNGRIGNAVGLDTPASLVALLATLRDAGYHLGEVDPLPANGDALIHRLIEAGSYDPDFGGEAALLPESPGLRLGNVFVGIQPPRGWDDDPDAVYHDPELPPPPVYVRFYRWLRAAPPHGWGTHAVIHLGKHGTLEWLPGKAVGLSAACAPDSLLGDLPMIYPFVVNDPGEGTQAKRRAHAVLIGHLVPPLGAAGLHDDLAAVERLIEEERAARLLDPAKLPLLRQQLWQAIVEAKLDEDLGLSGDDVSVPPRDAAALDHILSRLESYLHELEIATIRDGLHVLGRPPEGEQRANLLAAMTRLAPESEAPALRRRLDALLDRTPDELAAMLGALEGRFVPAGPSGSPSRGMWNVLPTGRNFYSVDPQAIPSPAAWETGRHLADALLNRYLDEAGAYPETVGLVIWGTAAMRTHGDDVAQALALLGVRPVWQPENGRVRDVEPVPLVELGRPRIDVTLHISGFFRDAFPHLVSLLDRAVQLVADLDEPAAQNLVAAHVRRDAARLAAGGEQPDAARRRASYRIFGAKPGCYGAGLLPLIAARNWRSRDDLVRAYETWSAYAYGQDSPGVADRERFRARFGAIDVATKNQDNREHDLFDSDDYFQYHGGMVAAARALRRDGPPPRAYFGDSANPRRPVVRTLDEEARRVFRSRVVNPRWLAAMRRHGYKGAFEMAATVDYLFGYDATAGVASDWMYERLAQAYVLDPEQQAFLQRSNPWALRDMAERLLEAASRGLWQQPDPDTLRALRHTYLESEGDLEAEMEVGVTP